MDKIKSFIWGHRRDILTVLILVLTVTAAFQLGRLSASMGGDALVITETP